MAGPARSRDEYISSLAGSLFSALLSEVIMDIALQTHRDIVRSRAVCEVCGMRCGSAHTQGMHVNGATSVAVPIPNSPGTAGRTAAATKEKSDGIIYFECTICQKKIASNRYAPHLSGCLGIGTGSRRGAARNAAAKNKLGFEPDRPGSPVMAGSDYSSPPEAVNGKGKGKAKNSKKPNGKVSDLGINGAGKRPIAHGPPSKKIKKQKTTIAGYEPTAALVSDDGYSQKPHVPTSSKGLLAHDIKTISPFASGSPSAASASQSSRHASPSTSGSASPLIDQSITGTFLNAQADPNDRSLEQADLSATKSRIEEDQAFIDVDGEDRDGSSSDDT